MWGWVRMKLRLTYGVPIAAVVLLSGAVPARSLADQLPPPSPPAIEQSPTPLTRVQLSAASAQIANYASPNEMVVPPPADIVAPPPAGTEQSVAVQDPSQRKPPASAKVAHRAARDKLASLPDTRLRADPRHPAGTGDGDRKVVQVRAVGPRQVGEAAWYGGRYIGRRTSSGERLDQIHATAAHRDLPLNSLVRVTNLNNGRSVIVRITDRGPVSESLLIDVSPKAADELAMKQAGIVRVAVEQVVEVPSDAR
jgi:rare lipoprotein A (peptidoglycan hydrolase)